MDFLFSTDSFGVQDTLRHLSTVVPKPFYCLDASPIPLTSTSNDSSKWPQDGSFCLPQRKLLPAYRSPFAYYLLKGPSTCRPTSAGQCAVAFD